MRKQTTTHQDLGVLRDEISTDLRRAQQQAQQAAQQAAQQQQAAAAAAFTPLSPGAPLSPSPGGGGGGGGGLFGAPLQPGGPQAPAEAILSLRAELAKEVRSSPLILSVSLPCA